MLEAIHEIAIYIHRFHNLDLFQQGWYQIKITMRWTGEDSGSLGTPARVAQYEAPDLGSDDVYGVWRIDDRDHSFSTQPFRIRYARQDILLSLMVSFTLQVSNFEGPCTSAVILKFELLYTPVLENRSNIQDCLDNIAAVHEFRLPPKALLGLHTYCPVHFDAFHAVLVDITVHVSLLRNAVYTSSQKVPRANTKKILEFLRNQWAVNRKAEWSIWMVHTKVDMPHQYISSLVDASTYHGLHGRLPVPRKLTDDPAQAAAMRAELHRRSIAQMMMNNRSIQDMHIFGDPARIPIVIVERVINAPLRSTSGNSYFTQLDRKDTNSLMAGSGSNPIKLTGRPNDRVLKIVVFVHGFQGHHLDLRLIRNQWLLLDPKTEFLMSEANEEKTSGDFRDMGRRLAQEVVSFVKKKMDKVSRSGVLRAIKLSFVGHSIGNIILRTALTESIMEPYLRYLHTYLSVSGPHLGYLYSSNSLFNGGLWVLKKLKNTQCIHQLTFTDDPDLRNTFLYKLAKHRTLENFRNVILLSSPQDGYVPYHSARIEMCPASSGDHSKKGKVFLEMLNECLDQIRARSFEHRVFMRCDVNFDVTLQGKNLNTIIGRAAHIEFLETDVFASFIMWSFPDLFR
ncbi:UNVERIFIED_CONTAM: hypothetical protein Scaly_1940000 [Sesamum calycinum]|uniref:DUF676 domain-containing protein n=1 Tax=Sesamum calycinum TaxID=2727403 RepID=A0AAW2NJ06_9LAMI